MSNPALEVKQTIRDRFKNFKGTNPADVWDDLWNEDTTPWDRGTHNPALEDALAHRTGELGTAIAPSKSSGEEEKAAGRKRALVPGCGRGVDVFLLAAFGYDAYGLEYSAKALEACREEERKYGDKIPPRNEQVGSGRVTFLKGDFFDDGWLGDAGLKKGEWDLIYDYSFFCALDPSLRPKWALRNSELLAPSPRGNLICLEFPTTKDPANGGPPFASPPAVYMEHLSHPGENIPYHDDGRVKANPLRETSEKGLERVAHWQPERTHKVGIDDKGNVEDWVSIWRRRN